MSDLSDRPHGEPGEGGEALPMGGQAPSPVHAAGLPNGDNGHNSGNGHRLDGRATAVVAPPSVHADSEVHALEIRNAIECLLLARGGPVRLAELRKVLEVDEAEIRATLAALQVEYVGRGLQIQEIAGGYQLCTRSEYGQHVQRLLRLSELEPLTRATLEVLAIVAYRQPVTRAEVDAVRGVQSVHHLIKLLDRRLIREVGRRPGPGRPILYGTTEGFLRYFGLRDLTALPPLADHDHPAVLLVPAP